MQPSDDNATGCVSRRSILTGAVATGLLGVIPKGWAAEPAKRFRSSLSVSPFIEQVLAKGITFTDGRSVADTAEGVQRLFVAHGSTEVYARIGTLRKFTPGNGDHGVERGLERARLAKKLGLPFNPEIGLFRSYGDAGGQPPPDFADYPQLKVPGPWHTLTVDQMRPILRDYGALIAAEILATGVTVNYWDLGNEVEFGVAGVAINPGPGGGWGGRGRPYQAPDANNPELGKMTLPALGKLPEAERAAWLAKHLWPHTGRLFAAVADGIRSVDKSARFSTHISSLGIFWPKVALRFFEVHRDAGYLPDQLGASYYPSSNHGERDPVGRMKETATLLHDTLKRPVFLAEYGYPASKALGFGGGTWTNEVKPYPRSPQGQADFTRDLVAWGVKTGHLSGVRPWAPDLVGPGWGAMSFFDLQGKTAVARPGLDAIADGLRVAGRG
jgi:arabinogalactan endo-1,4-beta-galactosidase